jgi:hypothetical protein
VLNRWIRSTALGYDRMITAAHLRFGPDFYALYGWEKPPKRTRLRAFVSFRETWSAPSILESLEDEEPHFGTWGASGIVLWLPSPSPPLDLLFTIPRNLRSSTIDNLTINALVDGSLARHHPHPLHFTVSLLVFLKSFLLPLQSSFSSSSSSSRPLALQSSGMNSSMSMQL